MSSPASDESLFPHSLDPSEVQYWQGLWRGCLTNPSLPTAENLARDFPASVTPSQESRTGPETGTFFSSQFICVEPECLEIRWRLLFVGLPMTVCPHIQDPMTAALIRYYEAQPTPVLFVVNSKGVRGIVEIPACSPAPPDSLPESASFSTPSPVRRWSSRWRRGLQNLERRLQSESE